MKSKLLIAIATLVGTIIGAGFLGIPYVVAKSGFLIGLIHIFSICGIMLLINLYLGEIVLLSKTQHQIPGYVSKYLGKKMKKFTFFALAIGIYAALTAYLIGEGESLSFLFAGSSSYSLFFSLIFWSLMVLATYKGIRSFKKIEPFAVLSVFFVTLILGIINYNKINLSNFLYINSKYFFLPFGVVFFAFLGVTAIPEMKRILIKEKKKIKKSIIIGSIIPLFVYILFTAVVMGLYGENIYEIATISFGNFVTILGILTMFTAFLALSLALQDSYRFDFGFSQKKAWLFSSFSPLIIFLILRIFNLASFVKILGIGGAVSGGLLGILILLMSMKAKKEKGKFKIPLPINWFIVIFLSLIFITGVVLEMIYSIF